MSPPVVPLLTKRQREVLEKMRGRRDEEDGELVMEGREVWLGLERSSPQLVLNLLRLAAIRLEGGEVGGVERYAISGTGLKLLQGNDEDLKLLAKARGR